jgi:hypothetical protein
MPNEDPMGAFLIEIPVLVVITGTIGGLVGFVTGIALGKTNRK